MAPDDDLTAALAGLASAPARVRGHYLLAILQWGMTALRGKATAAPAEGSGPRGEPLGAGNGAEPAGKAGGKRTRAPRTGSEDEEAAARPLAVVPLPPQQDARLWWLLAVLLGCEGLPSAEVQAQALLKPLLAACQAAPLPDQRTKGGLRILNLSLKFSSSRRFRYATGLLKALEAQG